MKFRCIVADPPWPYNIRGPASSKAHRPNSHGSGVSSRERYGSMSVTAICELQIAHAAANDAHLYLWTTNSFVVEAHAVARAWGFEYKTTVTWVKKKPDGTPSMKTGFYYRGATEHCLFCVRGRLKLTGPAHATAFETPRLPHSVKPDYFYDMVVDQSPGPRLELFARRKRRGWYRWGNEAPAGPKRVVEL